MTLKYPEMAQRVRLRKYLGSSRCTITIASLGCSHSLLVLPGPFPIRPGPSAGPPGKWKLLEMALGNLTLEDQPYSPQEAAVAVVWWLYGRVPETSWGLIDGRIMCGAELLTIHHHHTHSDIAPTVLYGTNTNFEGRVVVKGWKGLSHEHRTAYLVSSGSHTPFQPFQPVLAHPTHNIHSRLPSNSHGSPTRFTNSTEPPPIKYPPFCGRTVERKNKQHFAPAIAEQAPPAPLLPHPHPTNRVTAYRVILPVVRCASPGITGENASVASAMPLLALGKPRSYLLTPDLHEMLLVVVLSCPAVVGGRVGVQKGW
jgi:hypothetical protein